MAQNNNGLYFLKDKKAQIYNTVYVEPEKSYSNPIAYYVAVNPAPLWCYTRQLSQDQLFAAHAYWNDETRFFVFNFRDDVQIYNHVYYKGDLYEVTRVDRTDDYNGETFVYVKNVKGAKSDIERLRPYGWKPEDEGLKPAYDENGNRIKYT